MMNYEVIEATNNTWLKEQAVACLGKENDAAAVAFFENTMLCQRWELDSHMTMTTVVCEDATYYVMAEKIGDVTYGRFVNPLEKVVYMVQVEPEHSECLFNFDLF